MPGPAEMRMFRLAGLRLGVDREPRALLWPDASDVGHTIRLSRSPPPPPSTPPNSSRTSWASLLVSALRVLRAHARREARADTPR
jgi:hypothetical protein